MNDKIDPGQRNENHDYPDFLQFLQSMVSLNALDRMTTELGNELNASQTVMNEIKGIIDALPAKVGDANSEPESNGLRREDLSNILTAATPEIKMPDMDVSLDVDLDNVIATMRSYVEDLKKNFTQTSEPVTKTKVPTKQLESLELEQYASKLDQLCKQLSNLKLNKKSEGSNHNPELEAKLSVLCEDVNMFTQMIQATTTLSEAEKKWSISPQNTNALEYDNLINRLLADINNVSYLLLSKN